MNTQRFSRISLGTISFAFCIASFVSGVAGNRPISSRAQTRSEQRAPANMTPVPTPSPISTLTVAESEKRIKRLLNDNDGCKLPCWWGIVPGQSTKTDILQVVEPLNPIYVVADATEESKYGESIEVKYRAPLDGAQNQYYLLRNGRVSFISASTFNAGHTKLDRVLSTYGEPDVVLISAGIWHEDSKWYVGMDLLYTKLGFYVGYTTTALVRGNKLLACFATRSFDGIGITAWDVNNAPEDVLGRVLPQAGEYIRPLEEVSRETRKSMHRRYSRARSSYCIPIDADKWDVRNAPPTSWVQVAVASS